MCECCTAAVWSHSVKRNTSCCMINGTTVARPSAFSPSLSGEEKAKFKALNAKQKRLSAGKWRRQGKLMHAREGKKTAVGETSCQYIR